MRVVVSSMARLSFTPVRKAAALALAQLGVTAFFLAGVARPLLGESTPWFVLTAVLISGWARAVDIESWALFIPGGSVGRVQQAFGSGAARVAAASGLVERILLAALAGLVAGHYAAEFAVGAIANWRLADYVRSEPLAMGVAIMAIGLLWARARLGRGRAPDTLARGVWLGVGILVSSSAMASSASGPSRRSRHLRRRQR